MIQLDGIIDLMSMSLSKLRETVKDRGAQCAAVPKSQLGLGNRMKAARCTHNDLMHVYTAQ